MLSLWSRRTSSLMNTVRRLVEMTIATQPNLLDLLLCLMSTLCSHNAHQGKIVKIFLRMIRNTTLSVALPHLQHSWICKGTQFVSFMQAVGTRLFHSLGRSRSSHDEKRLGLHISLIGELLSCTPIMLHGDAVPRIILFLAAKLWKQSLCMHSPSYFLECIMPTCARIVE